MNCHLKPAFSRGSKGGKLYLIFSSGFIMRGPALGQIGPVGETQESVKFGGGRRALGTGPLPAIYQGFKWRCPAVCLEMAQSS